MSTQKDITLSTTTTKTTEIETSQPSWQDIEKALIDVVKAGLFYRNGNFLKGYKKRVLDLRQSEDPDLYIIDKSKGLIPNEEKYIQMMNDYNIYYKKEPIILQTIKKLYNLYYKIAKDHFIIEVEDDKAEDFLNE